MGDVKRYEKGTDQDPKGYHANVGLYPLPIPHSPLQPERQNKGSQAEFGCDLAQGAVFLRNPSWGVHGGYT